MPRPLTQSEAALVRADNTFAFKVFQAIAASAGPDLNLFISPLSASMALGMAYNGAAGTTQTEMQHALALEGLTLEDYLYSVQGYHQQDFSLSVGLSVASRIGSATTP